MLTTSSIVLTRLTPRMVAARIREGKMSKNATGGRVYCSNCGQDTGVATEDVAGWASGDRIECRKCGGRTIAKPIFFGAGFFLDLTGTKKLQTAVLTNSRKRVAKSTSKKKLLSTPNKTAKLTDNIIFIIDDSGSMRGLEPAVANMFNTQLETIRRDAKTSGRNTTISLFKFSEHLQPAQIDRVDINSVALMDSYRSNGYSTALRDAIGSVIHDYMNQPDANDETTSFLLFVLTDGEDNSSHNFSVQALQSLMQKAKATDRWTFGILGPPNSTPTITRLLGIDASNVREWEGTVRGVQRAAIATSSAYAVYSAARASGVRSVTRNLFEADLSGIKASQLNRQLVDVSGDFYTWKVDREILIRDFVENHGKTYELGKAYYELSKREEIQSYKRICILNKKDGTLYSGTVDELRGLLGFPTGQTIKVEPGNMATYAVFVQSTSVGRKLVRGTRLLYSKS